MQNASARRSGLLLRTPSKNKNKFQGKQFFENLVAFMSSDYVVGMELVGQEAIRAWRGLIGPTNSETARKEQPESLRAKFGTNGT